MSDSDDPARAADRLERALERIASRARRLQEPPAPPHASEAMAQTDLAPVAARLDALIAQLRTALR